MSSSSWRRGLIVALLLTVTIIGIVAFFAFQNFRGRNALMAAEQAYSEGRWVDAKQNYTWYIARHPDDFTVFPQYIKSCLNILNNRRDNVRDAGRAHLRLALADPTNFTLAENAVDFYRGHNLWPDLEYATSVFLRNHPENRALIFNKALADDVLGRTSEAITGYQRLIDLGEAEPRAYGNLANLLRKQGYEGRGWEVLDEALSTKPQDVLVRVERIKYSLALRDTDRATEELNQAAQSPNSPSELQLAAASVHAACRRYENSLALTRLTLDKPPGSYESHSLVVKNLIALRKMDEAITHLSDLDPFFLADNPRLYLMLAELQIDAQRIDGANRTIETYKMVAPGEGAIFDYLDARKLLESGNASEAAAMFAIVAERIPDLVIARYYLSIAYLENGDRERAKNALDMYLSNNPGDRRAQVLRDSVFAKRTVESIETEAADLLNSDAPYFASLLSVANSLTLSTNVLSEDVEHLELTERLYKRAIEDSPSVPEAYGDLAIHLLRQGKSDAARDVLEEAFAAGIEHESLDYPDAAILLAGGDSDRAKALFAKRLLAEDIDFDQAVLWVTLFAGAGQMDAGVERLEIARENESRDGLRQDLDFVELAVHTKFGNIDQAHTRLAELSEQYTEVPTMVSRLNEYRISIARLTLAPGSNQDTVLAEQLMQHVEESEPDRADAMVLRAQLLLQVDPPNIEDAESLCARANELAGHDMYSRLVRSEIAYKRGRFSKAKENAEKAHDLSTNRVYTGVVLARMQLQVGELSDALATLKEASQLAQDNPAIVKLMVRAYAGLGRFRQAGDQLRLLQDIRGGTVPLQLQASLLIARGEWGTAERALRQMYESNPADQWTIHFLAIALERQDRREEAGQFLNECVTQHPDFHAAWVELGNSHLRDQDASRLTDASLAFTQAIIRKPNDHRALRGLFEVQLRSNNPGAALGFCDRLLREIPDDYDMIRHKAMLLSQIQGREREALATVNHAIDIRPLAKLYYARGALHLKLGEHSNALRDFQFVEQSGEDTGGDLDTLMAEVYLELNDLELARSYYEAARSRVSQLQPKSGARLNRIAERLVEQ